MIIMVLIRVTNQICKWGVDRPILKTNRCFRIPSTSDGNKRGPRGQWPPSFWIGPQLFGDGGHRGPHLLVTKGIEIRFSSKILLAPSALAPIIH